MADNISVYVDALDNDAKFRLIDLNERAHTVPRTEKEKKLAAMGHPKDKITHKDILIGRGVLSREEAERIAEKVEELEEAPKGVLHKVSYTYDDPSGKGMASGAVKLHAPDKEAAKRYAAQHLALMAKHKKNVKIRSAMQIAEQEDTHYCAKHVFSERFGEGVVVEGAHAEPDENGLIEWYDVDFGGTVRRVMTEKVKVMHAEYHMNHKRKMKEEDDLEEMSSKEKMKRGLYNKEEAGKEHTVPRTEKEKKLAAMGHPKDKITHKDILIGRGVLSKEEVELDEAKSIKVGDFVRNAVDGKIHRVFDVRGNTLHTGEYHGKDAYGGDSILHKTKAVKVPKPADVTEEVEQIDELSSGTIDSYRKKLGAKLDTKPAYTSAAKSAQQQTNAPIRARIHNALMKQHQAIRRERGMSEGVAEEVEQLDEIGDTPAGKRALRAVQNRAADTMSDPSKSSKQVNKAVGAGVSAGNRLHGFGHDRMKKNTVMGRDALRKQLGVKEEVEGVAEGMEQDDDYSNASFERWKKQNEYEREYDKKKPAKPTVPDNKGKKKGVAEEVELEEAMHSPFRKAAMALRNKSFDPKHPSDDRATYSMHADLLASKDPKHHEASAKMMSGHDTYMRDQISDAVHQNSSKENSAKYHKMAGVKRLK